MDVAVVIWRDAHYNDEDGNVAEINHSPLITKTVGFLYKIDDTGVTLVWETYIGEREDEYKGYTFIPREMIIEIKEL
jgi:hypothetical protein